ncbi:DUF2948 family protein [Maricaulis sp.]|uniref:DUF2948 family protein n=1 Tax=Maricaulis sp. TaxID=1486257 RepID=UPI0026317B1D|nr:DUF2948 family protein [Maricaulis sp.]
MPKPFQPLRLSAVDPDDLQPISAALQDAIAQLGDFEFSRRKREFTLALNRYRWEAGGRKQRVRTGLQFAQVSEARSQNIRQGAQDAVVNLLSIAFEGRDEPAGEIVMIFSGGGELRLRVECIDAVMVDVSEPWPAASRPAHETGQEPEQET